MLERALLVFGVLLLPIGASAQTPAVQLQPFTFVAPGMVLAEATTLHVGGGLDVVHRSGLGTEVELGWVGPFPDGFDYGIGLLSVGGTYRWGEWQLRPLVAGGYTRTVFRGSGTNLLHFGGGFEYWMRPSLGLRVELRDYANSPDAHLLAARVGLAWALN